MSVRREKARTGSPAVRKAGALLPLFLFVFFSLAGRSGAAPKLDVGAEYRLRGLQFTNPTYGSEAPIGSGATTNLRYYSQRARVHLKGKFDPGIEIGTTLQAIGVAGSSAPLLNRYPTENFTPFIENAYVQMNEFQDWPISATLGRQPYTWGSGLLISDDGLGFDAIRLDVGPFWKLRGHFLAAKDKDRLVGENNGDLYLAGLSYKFGIHNILFGYISEKDQTGTAYTSLSATNPVVTDNISRQFFDLQVNGHLEKGAFYSAEYAMQKGAVNLKGNPLEVALSGSALTFEGGFDFIHPRYKRMILAFVFMQGSGDNSSSKNEDEAFHPTFGHKYDGLERSGTGDFFAATPYGFYNDDKVIVPIKVADKVVSQYSFKSLFSGLRMFGFRGSVNPWEPFTAGLEFYIFTARETPDIRNGAPTTIDDNEIGREMVLSGSYNYSKRINLSLRWGKLFPAANLNNVGSSRLTFEVSGKF